MNSVFDSDKAMMVSLKKHFPEKAVGKIEMTIILTMIWNRDSQLCYDLVHSSINYWFPYLWIHSFSWCLMTVLLIIFTIVKKKKLKFDNAFHSCRTVYNKHLLNNGKLVELQEVSDDDVYCSVTRESWDSIISYIDHWPSNSRTFAPNCLR